MSMLNITGTISAETSPSICALDPRATEAKATNNAIKYFFIF